MQMALWSSNSERGEERERKEKHAPCRPRRMSGSFSSKRTREEKENNKRILKLPRKKVATKKGGKLIN